MVLPGSKCDKILIITALSAAVCALVFMNFFLYKGTAKGFIVEVDGKIYAKYLFSELPKEKTLEINTAIGYNIIRIADNTVEVVNSSCRDGVCRHEKISKPNEEIVCLPNKLVVKIVGGSEVDSVSY